MRISLLLQREPFDAIFEKTLASFLQSRFQKSYTVKWRKAFSSVNPNSQVWLCNPYLNAIFVNKVNKEVLLPVIQEFSRSTVWWRRPFQKLYVDLSTKQWACKWFAPYIVEISPALKRPENILILGGNHHIRLLDYNEGETFVIHKTGFESRFLYNDIYLRRENPYLPCPRIHEVSEEGLWYSEELILGTPINRLKDVKQGKDAVKDVMTSLCKLYGKTARKVYAVEYVSGIIDRIKGCIRKYSYFNKETGDSILNDLSGLIEMIRFQECKKIIVAQTHGDFQPANILVGEKQPWLIDWEYTAERQIAYDWLVFALEARSSQGLGQRVSQAINADMPQCEQLQSTVPHVQWQDREERSSILMLFILEELELKIMEVCNPFFFRFDQGFEAFWKEAKQIMLDIAGTCR